MIGNKIFRGHADSQFIQKHVQICENNFKAKNELK